MKNKSASADAQFSGKTVRRDGLSFLFASFETRVGHRVSRVDFGLCGVRPGSTWTGQPARLDRARELVPWTPIVACGRDSVIFTDSEYSSADAQFSGKTVRRDGLSFLFASFETRVGHRVSKGEFRTLRSPTQGSALRTCGLSRKAGESFNYGCGAYLREYKSSRLCRNTGQFSRTVPICDRSQVTTISSGVSPHSMIV